jgi:hypothetical protein
MSRITMQHGNKYIRNWGSKRDVNVVGLWKHPRGISCVFRVLSCRASAFHGPQFQGAVPALLFSFSNIADYAAKQLNMPFLGQYNR